MIVDTDLLIEEKDMEFIIGRYLRGYLFHSQDKLPRSIVFPDYRKFTIAESGTEIPVVIGKFEEPASPDELLDGMPEITVKLQQKVEAAKEAKEQVFQHFKRDPNAKPLTKEELKRTEAMQATSLPGSVFQGEGGASRDPRINERTIAKDLMEDETVTEEEMEAAEKEEDIVKGTDGSITVKPKEA